MVYSDVKGGVFKTKGFSFVPILFFYQENAGLTNVARHDNSTVMTTFPFFVYNGFHGQHHPFPLPYFAGTMV
jgi:hypothetical protein